MKVDDSRGDLTKLDTGIAIMRPTMTAAGRMSAMYKWEVK